MNLDYIFETFVLALHGVPITLLIAGVSIIFSIIPAILLALGRIHKIKGVTTFSIVYLAFIRATPPILLILFFYSLLPSLLNRLLSAINSSFNIFNLSPIYYAFIIFSFLTTGSLSEIFRSALSTVSKQQLEAGQSVGLTTFQTYRRIIFPQALISALPNLSNLTINLVKGTSLVFVMTIKDITAIAKVQAAHGYQYFESYFVIFVIYLLLCGGLQGAFYLLNRQLNFRTIRKEQQHVKSQKYPQALLSTGNSQQR
ncbi:amino acid ABC transporter permease [Enterococcus dongliensis]|uniref:Amino acid ABC transporter permease n=1 Tax=Enterococcus dongliensis TaxID=2559925 RepID=A0AAP5NM11_9ENTE|nr:amino acid ABC transporter permease [Enterococcus dongliensis]MDT2597161.1 amino acid ABC transporter permease [Enterococcus dongliensis]MDT2604450.1 amino acid ABC transporter permease [Enterococcus dongliensis]MDT2635520.1 amino acid ABC transporter permease [Enterococcus dongliensis]MDT2638114.1 amino acid ABC transporter permease [Enterococcus dongliensis]MDT2642966.1 amino acid ABC transporter permease [Enterococcus dongliensis]